MKVFFLLALSAMIGACSSPDRDIASEEQQDLQQTERAGDFEPGYRH